LIASFSWGTSVLMQTVSSVLSTSSWQLPPMFKFQGLLYPSHNTGALPGWEEQQSHVKATSKT
jgi:hypothetical protein